MYVKVMYGDNELMLCNTSCAVVNLLASIRCRAGLKKLDSPLDLSDETGLVKELHGHNGEMAEKFLGVDGTYVLLRKLDTQTLDTPATQVTPATDGYAPLLENCAKLLPGYQVHVKSAQVATRGTKVRGQRSPTQASRASKMATSATAAVPTSVPLAATGGSANSGAPSTPTHATSAVAARPKANGNGSRSNTKRK